MNPEQEHELVPAIRDWLSTTSTVEVPSGLSREEARRRARVLLDMIVEDTAVHDHLDVDDDLEDILWATVDELDDKSPSQATFEKCDRFYRFAAALPLENDLFHERDDVLHRVAQIGWRSAPGGLPAALKIRASIWDHGDEQVHRDVWETADQIPEQIEAVRRQALADIAKLREITARLLKLSSIRPSVVAPAATAIAAQLAEKGRRIGYLDDSEHLTAILDFAAAAASRQLGIWDCAESGYARAASAFRRTADTSDLDRVNVERLALLSVRGGCAAVADAAPTLIRSLVVPRDRIKAQLILSQALLDLDRPQDARLILETVAQNPAIEHEHAFRAWLLTKLGTALSYLGKDAEAVAAFNSAGAILRRFAHPLQLADLTGALGEHLGKRGKLEEASALYGSARAEFRRVGQAKFVGYYSVLLAELLVLRGEEKEAELELLAALPLIERFDLKREAVAAVGLLREAIAKRCTDLNVIQTLRDQLRRGLH